MIFVGIAEQFAFSLTTIAGDAWIANTWRNNFLSKKRKKGKKKHKVPDLRPFVADKAPGEYVWVNRDINRGAKRHKYSGRWIALQ